MRLDDYNNMQVNAVIEKRKKVRELARFETYKRRLFLIGIFISMILIVMIYFLNPRSNISKVTVTGNHYLARDYILDVAKVNEHHKYLLTFDFIVKRNIKNEPLIKDVKVHHNPNNILHIEIVEKQPVAYLYTDRLEILLEDGTIIKDNDEYISLISRLPIITGFSKDLLKDVAHALNEMDPYIIESISEINHYSQSYDQNMLQMLMRDGNYVFVSFYSTEVLNNYFYISNQIAAKKSCIYVEDISKNAYLSACPWVKDDIEEPESVQNDEKSDTN